MRDQIGRSPGRLVAIVLPAAFLALVVAWAAPAFAEGWATGWGCFTCKTHNPGTDPDYKCWFVGDNQTGQGIHCDDEWIVGGHVCVLSGGQCLNTDWNEGGGGGGSGGGGGGGGSSCSIRPGAWCPAECPSCATYF